MANSLTDLVTWRDALLQARLSGIREIQDQNGERIRYATDAEMSRAIAAADAAIASATRPRSGMFRVLTSKGI